MLETGWLKVATAGKTIDGRDITPEMLERAAELYGLETYTAVVNSEHFFYAGLGYVSAVKAEADEQGRMALWAKLVPTAELITRNAAKRQLFFSMELMPGFPEEGDWYLFGLAVTDIPASQGLAPQLFKAGERTGERFLNTAKAASEEIGPWQAKAPAGGQDETPGWAANFLASIKSLLPGGATSPEQEEPMTKEEKQAFEALQANVAKLTTAVEKLTAEPPKADPKAAPKGDEPAADPAKAGADPAKEPVKAGAESDAIKAAVAEALKPVTTEIEAIKAKLGEPMPGTTPLTVDKPSDGGAAEVW